MYSSSSACSLCKSFSSVSYMSVKKKTFGKKCKNANVRKYDKLL